MLRTALQRLGVTRPELDRVREKALKSRAFLESRAPTSDCLDELAIADFVDGTLAGERREQVLAHLGGCAHCCSVVKATAALVADASLAREVPGPRRTARRWAQAAIGVAAAAAVVLLAVMPRDRGMTLREPAVTNATAPVTLSPRGSVSAVERLVWSKVPGAERYRLRIHRQDGTVVWSSETADTSLALPASVRLEAPGAYSWRVEAETGWRRWVDSEMTPFRLEIAEFRRLPDR